MDSSWVCIYETKFLHQAEISKAVLEEHDIPSVIVNKQDSAYVTIGEIELYVKRENVIRAKQLITPLGQ